MFLPSSLDNRLGRVHVTGLRAFPCLQKKQPYFLPALTLAQRVFSLPFRFGEYFSFGFSSTTRMYPPACCG
jgi:hypothetical protein